MNMDVYTILLTVVLGFTIWTVVSGSLLKSAIGLAITSALISVVMFKMNAPLAAVFELSVCAGLITAIFVSAISLTKPLSHQETKILTQGKYKKYRYLPVVLVAVGIFFAVVKVPLDVKMIRPVCVEDVRSILWNVRQFDLLGQVVLMLAGAFGIVILFKEVKR